MKERTLGYAGLGAEFVDRGGRVALLADQRKGCIQQLLPYPLWRWCSDFADHGPTLPTGWYVVKTTIGAVLATFKEYPRGRGTPNQGGLIGLGSNGRFPEFQRLLQSNLTGGSGSKAVVHRERPRSNGRLRFRGPQRTLAMFYGFSDCDVQCVPRAVRDCVRGAGGHAADI